MGSMLGNWPSYDPHNFSQLRPSNPAQPSKLTAVTYHPTHNRTLPPANQGLTLLFEKHCMPDRGPRFKCDLPFPRGSSTVQRFYQHAPIKTSRPTKMHTTPIIRKQVVWDARHGVFPGHRRKKKVISTEETNILLRQFYQRAEDKLRTKRSAPDNLTPDHGCKQPRGSFEGGPN